MAAQSDQLTRLLTLIPYFLARQGITLEQAAADLDVGEDKLVKDLDQLFVCGLPGKYQYPDDLIDISYSEGHVHVNFSAGIDRPLQLTSTEATVLLTALRALTQTHAAAPDAVERAIAKIAAAVGAESAPAAIADNADPARKEIYETIRRAVHEGHALSIRYYTASRDSISDRIVDPVTVQVTDGSTYLSAWCRSSGGMRLFRFDRIDAARILDEPAQLPPDATAQRPSPIMSENADLPTVELDVDATARWAFEYYLLEQRGAAGADGVQPATLRYGSDEWLTRFILGFGGHIRITGPGEVSAQVIDQVTREATAARARYN
ncbi:helix-turn-helix transcriptional regulator [Gordonia sp. CPCC 205333]|uniref:helix-turn-helix transcriptional regulator n=1 Tax=Gordonia sp. CPCC 205333 TaxID=3140790 RepID=UPI003AF3C025